MAPEETAMVGKKTDENVLGVWSRCDCIENSPEAIVQISDLPVITRLHDFRWCRINCVRPNRVPHKRNFFVKMIFLDLAENCLWQSIGIIHPVEGNRRSQWWMRPDERHKSEERPRII